MRSFRFRPRAQLLIVALYGLAFYRVMEWFMALNDPSANQAAFVSTIVGAGAAFFGFYVNSGPNSGRGQE